MILKKPAALQPQQIYILLLFKIEQTLFKVVMSSPELRPSPANSLISSTFEEVHFALSYKRSGCWSMFEKNLFLLQRCEKGISPEFPPSSSSISTSLSSTSITIWVHESANRNHLSQLKELIGAVFSPLEVKFWPRPRWRHVSLLSTLWGTSELSSDVHLFPTSSRSSPLQGFFRSEGFSSEPSNSSNSSPLISVDSYATLFFSTFIMCDATQRGQL